MRHYKLFGGQHSKISSSMNRCMLMRLLFAAFVFMVFALIGCDLSEVDASAKKESEKDKNMESTQSITPMQHKIPPIDAAALTEYETATFALG